MNLSRFLPPYSSSTIFGMSLIAGAVTSVLTDTLTLKQALAGLVTGGMAWVIRQSQQGPTVVTGAQTTVNAEEATVQAGAGATISTKGPRA